MKTLLLAVVIMSISSVVGPTAEQLNRPAVETELRKLNYEVAQMQVRKDVAAARRLLADEYIFLQADGQISNKVQNIEILESGDFVCRALTTDEVQVRVYGDTALVIGRAHFDATYKGKDVGGDFRYTDVWVRREGRWQNVASQATRLPPASDR